MAGTFAEQSLSRSEPVSFQNLLRDFLASFCAGCGVVPGRRRKADCRLLYCEGALTTPILAGLPFRAGREWDCLPRKAGDMVA